MGSTTVDVATVDVAVVDVAVVGGGPAGCSTAIRFSRMGHRVVVLEKKAVDDQHYKRLCTHFIQPSAAPLLTGLGLASLHEPANSVRTKARFITSGGVISTPGGYVPDDPDSHALNLERRVLDPAMRDAARRAGAELIDATAVERLERDPTGWWSIETSSGDRAQSFRARLVVAADGRQSRLAKRLDNPTTSRTNDRAAMFGYFTGIEAPQESRSLFILYEREMTFLYPLVGGRTLLSVYVDKSRAARWRHAADPIAEFLRYCAGMPDMPSLADAEPETELLGYGDYPSLIRQPVWNSVAFVGDASLSLDPMSGVGCGFALQSADLLAKAFVGRSLEGTDVDEGLDAYRREYERVILPHAEGICADSLMEKNAAAQLRVFQTISESAELSQQYLGLTGRIVLPAEFQRELMHALMRRPRGNGPPPRAPSTPVRIDANR